MGRACGYNRIRKECIQNINRHTSEKIPLGKPTHRCKDNIRIDLVETFIKTRNDSV